MDLAPEPSGINEEPGTALEPATIHITERRTARGFDAGSLVRAGLWLAILASAVWFLSHIHFTLVIFGLAWLIAYLMNPVVAAMERMRLPPFGPCPRPAAVGAVYLFLFAMAALGGSLFLPILTGQINRLVEIQQTFYDPHKLAAQIQEHGTRLVRLIVPEQYRATLMERLRTSLGTITTEVGKDVASGLSHLAEFFGQVLAGAVIFMSAMLISIYMLLNWRQLKVGVVSAFPIRYQDDVRGLLSQMNRIFGGYLRATILTSLACTASTLVSLFLFGLISGQGCPYAVIISIIAGLTYPIPLFGILTSTCIGGILAFVPDNDMGVGLQVAVIVLVVNTIIDRTLLPKLMSDAIGVSPLFVIFAAAAGGEFMGGVSGMLLGIPLAAMFKAVFVWFHGQFLTIPDANPAATLLHHPSDGASIRVEVADLVAVEIARDEAEPGELLPPP